MSGAAVVDNGGDAYTPAEADAGTAAADAEMDADKAVDDEVDPTTGEHDGLVHIHLDWQKVYNYNKNWAVWAQNESRDPAFGDVAQALNHASEQTAAAVSASAHKFVKPVL